MSRHARRLHPAVLAAKLRAPRPTCSVCHPIGVELARDMEPTCTLEELGAALGVTKQNAYHESCVALGKLAWHMARRLKVVQVVDELKVTT